MMDPNAFAKMVPGFDFLQSLMQSAGQAAPAMGQWIAPTLNPEELDKRIGELKTVQFWLEQNARMISVTVQALEVQRMTLSTLQTMNLPMAELRNALTLPTASAAPTPAPRQPAISPAPPPPEATPEAAKPAPAEAPAAASAKASAAKPAVDPMQWWGALTQQFTELATKAMQDGGALAARNLAAAAETAPAVSPKAKPAPKPATRRATAKKPAAKASRKRA
jgi:hypothetical protein